MPIIPSVGGPYEGTSILQGRSGYLGTDHIPTKHPPQLLHYTRSLQKASDKNNLPQLTCVPAHSLHLAGTTGGYVYVPAITENLLCCFSKCLDHINGATSHAADGQLQNAMKNTTPV